LVILIHQSMHSDCFANIDSSVLPLHFHELFLLFWVLYCMGVLLDGGCMRMAMHIGVEANRYVSYLDSVASSDENT
jgi:hypothetical protein